MLYGNQNPSKNLKREAPLYANEDVFFEKKLENSNALNEPIETNFTIKLKNNRNLEI